MSVFEYEEDFEDFKSGRVSPNREREKPTEKTKERWFNCKSGFFFLPRDIRIDGLSSTEFRVLVTLASFVFQRDQATPGLETLSAYTGLKKGTISKATTRLVKKGWLNKQQRYKKTNIYYLRLPAKYNK